MKFIKSIIIVALLIYSAVADTTYVDGEVSGIWTAEGNPYIVSRAIIQEDDTLNIHQGVQILLYDYGYFRVNGVLNAFGANNDSIKFIPYDRSWIDIEGSINAKMEFNYCHFEGMFGADDFDCGAICALNDLIVRNCSFDDYTNGVSFSFSHATISQCRFDETDGFAIIGRDATERSVLIENCVFERVGHVSPTIPRRGWGVVLSAAPESQIRVYNSLFLDTYLNCSGEVYSIQNIFLNDSAAWIKSPWGENEDSAYVRNNCFIGHNPNPFDNRGAPEPPEGFAITNMTNLNGDSCDAYGNIFLDPRIIEGWAWGDSAFLMEDSPCIDAGDPESPLDPDSTVADMGPFYFSQPNIALSTDSLVFPESIIDDADTVFFTIRNRGDRRDLRYYLDAPDLSPEFWLFDWNEDTASLAAGESIEIAMQFLPRVEGEYFDTLTITSNDRDEGVFRLPIRGSASNVGVHDSTVNPPRLTVLLEVNPNPFNSATLISVAVPEWKNVSLVIHDLAGKEVSRLFETGSNPVNSVLWDATGVPSGVYFARLSALGKTQSIRLIQVR